MVKEFLKIAGVKTQGEFYKKYPSEEAFFRAHPEAMHLQKMAYGGINAYDGGGPILPGTLSKAIADYKQSQAQPQVGADGMTDFIRRPQETPVVAAAPSASHFALNPYQGVSVYDMLEAQGKAGDYKSRKGLAKTLGISGYKGLPEQNAQMMEMIRQNPDVLLNYTGASAPMASAPKKSSSSSTKAKSTSTKKETAPVDKSGSLLGGFKSEYDFEPPTINQVSIGTSKTGISKNAPGYGKKGDAYADGLIDRSVKNKAMTDYSTQQYFNEELQKALGKTALSGVGLGAARNLYEYFQPRYYPYNPNQLPAPGARPIPGQRALPPSQKMLPPSTPRGWTMGEGAYRSPNFPFNRDGGEPCYNCGGGMYADGGENDYSGTYSNGVYYGAGGTYIPTPMMPGQDLPKFMYGMEDGGNLDKYQIKGNVDTNMVMRPPYFGNDFIGTELQRAYPPMPIKPGENLSQLAGQHAQGLSDQMFNDWRESEYNRSMLNNMNRESKNYYINPKTGKVGNKNKNGGLVKGSVHDMSEAQIQDLINQGYKIEYI